MVAKLRYNTYGKIGKEGNLENLDTKGQSKIRKHFPIIALSAAVVVTSAVMLHVMFSADVSNLTIEILAAVVAVVMVVVSVAVTLHFQADYEAEKEFKTEVFKHKLTRYYALLEQFSEVDNDLVIDSTELKQMKNLARSVALISSPDVVVTLANYIQAVEKKKELYIGEEDIPKTEGSNKDLQGTFRNLVIKMRKDLEVLDLERFEEVREAVGRLVRPSSNEDDGQEIGSGTSASSNS